MTDCPGNENLCEALGNVNSALELFKSLFLKLMAQGALGSSGPKGHTKPSFIIVGFACC